MELHCLQFGELFEWDGINYAAKQIGFWTRAVAASETRWKSMVYNAMPHFPNQFDR